MYDIEKLYEATSVADAISALQNDPAAIIISGGSDVLIKIREGKLAGCSLVSIHGIPELSGIFLEQDGTIIIKPATTFSHITYNEIIQKYIPILGNAVDQVGGPQIRNIGTVGGNICNGVTSADSASTLFTLNAVIEITGANGKRQLPIAQFYKSAGKVNLEHGEIVTAIRIAKENYEGFGGHYIKYAQRNAM
ncbi:MAG: FAD binding domain-containing protein, partial [Hydrogenoanaerobacterium sp.]